ncbi:hypothetical protein WDW86_01135 [Bdellovibrionota bacterium FG-2]
MRISILALSLLSLLFLPATTFAMGRVRHDSAEYLKQISHPTFGTAVILPDNTVWSMALPQK